MFCAKNLRYRLILLQVINGFRIKTIFRILHSGVHRNRFQKQYRYRSRFLFQGSVVPPLNFPFLDIYKILLITTIITIYSPHRNDNARSIKQRKTTNQRIARSPFTNVPRCCCPIYLFFILFYLKIMMKFGAVC